MIRPGVVGWTSVLVLLVLHVFLAASSARHKSLTLDEPTHLFAGYAYWTWGDFRIAPEVGNWAQRWLALPAVAGAGAQDVSPPDAPVDWRQTPMLAADFLFADGHDHRRLTRQARAMALSLSIALAIAVLIWAGRLGGPLAGGMAVATYLLSPTMLAHAPLLTPDLAVSLASLAAVGAAWWAMHRISIASLVLSSLALAAMLLTKATGLIGLAAIGLMWLARLAAGRPIEIRLPGHGSIVASRARQLAVLALAAVIQASLVAVLIWASYGFRFASYGDEAGDHLQPASAWEGQLEDQGPIQTLLGAAREHRVLPEAYLFGLAFALHHADSGRRVAFLDGRYSADGFLSFFPRAFVYKSALGELLLLALASGFLAARWRSPETASLRYALLPVLIFSGFYGLVAITSPINIGHRHILPLYPFAFLIIGVGGALALRSVSAATVPRIRWILGGLLAILTAETALAWPHYLAFFNRLAGGSEAGYQRLTDSSVDWGQDLPSLARWLQEQGLKGFGEPPVYLAYYGSSPPREYGVELPEIAGFGHIARSIPYRLRAGVYVVSATALQVPYGRFAGRWNDRYEATYQSLRAAVEEALAGKGRGQPDPGTFDDFVEARFARLAAALRERVADDRIAHSLLVYVLDEDDLRSALVGDGPARHPDNGIGEALSSTLPISVLPAQGSARPGAREPAAANADAAVEAQLDVAEDANATTSPL